MQLQRKVKVEKFFGGVNKKRKEMNEIIEIPLEKLHDEAFKIIQRQKMDFLESLTGMDWGDSLGEVYHLESTVTGERMTIKTLTTDRENPEIPSVCDIWKAAEFNEREVYDFYGIRFIGHPDMRRLFYAMIG